MSECRSRVEDLLGKFKVKESDLVEVSYCDLLEQRYPKAGEQASTR